MEVGTGLGKEVALWRPRNYRYASPDGSFPSGQRDGMQTNVLSQLLDTKFLSFLHILTLLSFSKSSALLKARANMWRRRRRRSSDARMTHLAL